MASDPQDGRYAPSNQLESIETNWSLVELACRNTSNVAVPARSALVLRYLPAIQTYIRTIVKSVDMADDLAQDVCVRIMRGDFAGADPSRGRFRGFLKTAVRNQVRNYVARERVRFTVELSSEMALSPFDERAWVKAWREAVLDMVWRAMEAPGRGRADSVGTRFLKLRVEHPELSIEELGHSLDPDQTEPLPVNSLRAMLYRARKRFCLLLLEEVARTLDRPTPEAVQEEAAALDLLQYLPESLFPPANES